MTLSRSRRWLTVLAAAVMGLLLATDIADARAGRGGGFGLVGAAAIGAARDPDRPARGGPTQRQPGPAISQAQASGTATAARPGFGRGGLFGGLVGAGLIGMLLGYGFFGGLGGLGSLLGLLLQVGLIGGLIMLALRFFRSRQPAFAGGPAQRQGAAVPPLRPSFSGGGAAPRRAGDDEVGIVQVDFDAFERILGEVQQAYGRGDRAALRALALPEVSQPLERELDGDEARDVVNKVSDIKLQQGDLAEAWREAASDYATVAMRFSLKDHVKDRRTGQIVEGDPTQPTEATEIWTFRRDRAGPWQVAAIQSA